MTDDIEVQRRALKTARDDSRGRSTAFASTTPIPPGQEVPVMQPEAQKAYEEVVATQIALKEFEESHPGAF